MARTKQISDSEKIRAAVNLPAETFTLGDRTFELRDLPYDDYLEFVDYVKPLIDTLINRVTMKTHVEIPGIELNTAQFDSSSVLTFCGASLPKMVQIICRQTDPDISVEEIKALAKRPTVLASIVMRQMAQNDIIKDFADFFGQMVKTLTAFRMTA